MDLGIAGRRAAVAAASSGLGLATARALAAEGVRVAICAREPKRLASAAASLGERAIALEADVGNPEGAARFVAQARERLGGLDILVPNAGGPPPGNFRSTPLDAYLPALHLNLLSVVAMCREAVPGMQEQRWGRVLAITSSAVRQPLPNLILSNTARAGATGFLKTLALEVARDGVTVNSLQPGLHDTPRVRALRGGDSAALQAMAAGVPVGRLGSADDFGRIAAFLCSEHARFVTGAALLVDGGAYLGLL
jgi:3-oxoacyl-[acyl-carrier protein] reductase